MSNNKDSNEIYFDLGHRRGAILMALDLVKEQGQPAQLIICKDIPGEHIGGAGCFCDPRIVSITPEEL